MSFDDVRDHLNNRHQQKLEQFMATLTEDLSLIATALSALIADDEAKTQQIATLEAQVASLDPNAAADLKAAQDELAAAQSQVEALTAQINAALPPPPAPVPEALTVAPDSLTAANGDVVSTSVVASGGTAPYTYAGDLSALGMAVDGSGNVTGTAVTGSGSFTVSDSAVPPASVSVSVSVA